MRGLGGFLLWHWPIPYPVPELMVYDNPYTRCNQPGHRAANCPRLSTVSPSSCYKCGQEVSCGQRFPEPMVNVCCVFFFLTPRAYHDFRGTLRGIAEPEPRMTCASGLFRGGLRARRSPRGATSKRGEGECILPISPCHPCMAVVIMDVAPSSS